MGLTALCFAMAVRTDKLKLEFVFSLKHFRLFLSSSSPHCRSVGHAHNICSLILEAFCKIGQACLVL